MTKQVEVKVGDKICTCPSTQAKWKMLPTLTTSMMSAYFTDSGTSVFEQRIFTRALAMQSSGGNCSPTPDVMLWKLVSPRSPSPEELFSQTPAAARVQVKLLLCVPGASRKRW